MPPTSRIDFAQLRRQVTMADALARLGWLDRLKGSGLQRRGPCPIHRPPDPRSRTFSVHLGKNVFQCFDPDCRAHGNVLDLWAAVHHQTVQEAAHTIARTFGLTT